MILHFEPITAHSIPLLTPYFGLRDNKTCDSVFLDMYLWKDFYKVHYAVEEGKALYLTMEIGGETYAAVPICAESELPEAFLKVQSYFNEALGKKLKIYLADEAALEILHLDPEAYAVNEVEDAKDYLYSAEALRKLPGKKLGKKKNHINAFLREHEGTHEYRTLDCAQGPEVWNFLMRWRDQKDSEALSELEAETAGIYDVLNNCTKLRVRIGGVYVDKVLQAFYIGSYNERLKMAIIHIEKADPEIRGLYPYINQQFLLHEFPDAELVNREDDMGLPGLRKAKLSYDPIDYARKFRIEQQ